MKRIHVINYSTIYYKGPEKNWYVYFHYKYTLLTYDDPDF